MYFFSLSIFESDIVLSFSSGQYVFQLNAFFFTYRLSLWKDCTAGSFYSSLFMSELLNQNIKRVRYLLTHYRKE